MEKNYFYKTILLNHVVVCLLCFSTSCAKDIGKSPALVNSGNGSVACDTISYTYNIDVKTIIDNNCAGCHFAGSSNGTLTDYLNLQAKSLNGSVIGSLKAQGYAQMPPTGKLSDCEIKGIEDWIQKGAPNN